MQTVVAEQCERPVDGPAGSTGIVSQAKPQGRRSLWWSEPYAAEDTTGMPLEVG